MWKTKLKPYFSLKSSYRIPAEYIRNIEDKVPYTSVQVVGNFFRFSLKKVKGSKDNKSDCGNVGTQIKVVLLPPSKFQLSSL